ncbi:hypothetical protein [Roseococcus pinisoli]|uniref:Uncharacterized protein n=1 Tax=Roseococcus pinisoli TaxID=2835040 RepID=A0ABS5QFM0_9PROT|nr:hypothetical protein [Roseococcus pinisoli]MBS7812491.1 hypothetical protein [Roseococcus pinisoli]
MRALEETAREPVAWVNEEWPLANEAPELPEEIWLPARDVSLMTLAAFAFLAVLYIFH